MKEITEQKQIVETITKYESIDGKVFDTKEACAKWEKSYEGTIEAMWADIPKVERGASDYLRYGYSSDETVFFVNVRDENDIKVINAMLDIYHGYIAKAKFDDIGKVIIIAKYCYENELYYLGTVEEYLQSIKNDFEKVKHEAIMANVNKTNEEAK